MVRQAAFFDVEERLRELSAKGDDLHSYLPSFMSRVCPPRAPM